MGEGEYSLLLDIPGLPRLQSGTLHWRLRHKERREWHEAVGWEIQRQGGTKVLPPEPLQSAHLCCTRYSPVEGDYDNLVVSFKPLLDGLKIAGVIADDHPSVIGRPLYRWKKAPPKKGHVRIEVTTLAPLECPTCGREYREGELSE